MDGKIPADIEKTAAWITAHRLDLRKEAGIQISQMIAEALRDERSRRDAELSRLREALKGVLNEETQPVNVGYDEKGNFIYADAVRTDSDSFAAARTALNESREGE